MAVPDFQTMMLPLLQFFSDGNEHGVKEASAYIVDYFKLSDEEKYEKISRGMPRYVSNTQWVITYFRKAILLENTKRGVYRITERGKKLIDEKPAKIDIKLLKKYPEFVEFVSGKSEDDKTEKPNLLNHVDTLTPEDIIDASFKSINSALADEILSALSNCSPSFFEKIVVDVLLGMGYGGYEKEAGVILGKSGDEGVDGVINEDKLGLDVIYIQAKRWADVVGRPEIQKFVGTLAGKKAKKGVFITTSRFSKDAEEFVKNIDTRVVLIDGRMLARLMIDYNVGVSVKTTYEIKRIDSDYFEE